MTHLRKQKVAYFACALTGLLLLGAVALTSCTSTVPESPGTSTTSSEGTTTMTDITTTPIHETPSSPAETTEVTTSAATAEGTTQPATEDTIEEAPPAIEDTTEEAPPATEDTTEEAPPATDATYSWSNPIRYAKSTPALRDPFILKVGDVWYMTGTLPPYGLAAEAERTKGVPLYKSTDMTTWEFVDYIVRTPAESEGKWYAERFWAAELFSHNGKFYVTVNCCRVDGSNHGFLFAVADDIEGPYTIMNPDEPLALGNDAHLFVDTDGQTYIFASNISYAKIDLDSLTLLSDWKTAVSPIKGSDAWNGQREGVGFEGPYVLTTGGKYYLFYSTWSRGYEVGLAVADSVTGGWSMYAAPMYGGMVQDRCDYYGGIYEEGYYENQDKYRECGHNSVFEGPDGEMWIAAHAYVTGNTSTPMLIIDRLVMDGERGILSLDTNTGKTVNGPTYGDRSVTYTVGRESVPLHALDVWKYADQNRACVLPDQVDLLLENGFRRCVPVVWSAAPDTSSAGEFTVSGTATYKGVEYPVTAHISVRNTAAADCDFEDVAVGSTDFGDDFANAFTVKFQMYEQINRGPVVIAEQDGNRFLRCTAYLLAEMTLPMTDTYAVSLDWRCLDAATAGGVAERLGGIVIRGGDQTHFPHYEEENKISKKCIGASGLLVLPAEDGFRVVVKTFDEATDTVTHSEVFIKHVNGLDFTTLTVTEEASVITVTADGATLFTATLSDRGGYKGATSTYYRSVTLRDADGGSLLQVSNAFLTVEPAFHIVSRGWTAFDLDNLQIRTE